MNPSFKDGYVAAGVWWQAFNARWKAVEPYSFPSELREFALALPSEQLPQFLDAIGEMLVTSKTSGEPSESRRFNAARVDFCYLSPQEQDSHFTEECEPVTDMARAMLGELDADAYVSSPRASQGKDAPSPESDKPAKPQAEPLSIGMIVWRMQLMEKQKERVDALLLALKDQLDKGTFSYILADLAKSIQEDHGHWYELQEHLGISEQMRVEADHD